jgi:uncharacterized protein YybS (DUF2232 family)
MNSGRRIAEGGALLALYCILLFITIQIPLLGIFTTFFLPIPFILVTIKQKLSWSLGYLFVASLLSILIGTILSVPLTLLMGATGIAIGYFEKDKSMATCFHKCRTCLPEAFINICSSFDYVNYMKNRGYG